MQPFPTNIEWMECGFLLYLRRTSLLLSLHVSQVAGKEKMPADLPAHRSRDDAWIFEDSSNPICVEETRMFDAVCVEGSEYAGY